MVAYSSDFCLPYLEGTDSPCLNTGTVCDPSSAWCDMIALVEAQLDAVDAIVARTGAAIPLARVSYVPDVPTVLGFANPVPFNVVDSDTDDMVDLGAFPGIIPKRDGVYEILAEVLLDTTPHVNPQNQESFYILAGNETIFNTNQGNLLIGDGYQRTVPNYPTTAYAGGGLWNFTSSLPNPRTITIMSVFNTSPVISMNLTVFWHSEAV